MEMCDAAQRISSSINAFAQVILKGEALCRVNSGKCVAKVAVDAQTTPQHSLIIIDVISPSCVYEDLETILGMRRVVIRFSSQSFGDLSRESCASAFLALIRF